MTRKIAIENDKRLSRVTGDIFFSGNSSLDELISQLPHRELLPLAEDHHVDISVREIQSCVIAAKGF